MIVKREYIFEDDPLHKFEDDPLHKGDLVDTKLGIGLIKKRCDEAPFSGWICNIEGTDHKIDMTDVLRIIESKFAQKRKRDLDYLVLAKTWAEMRSKDPSTKVGAIVLSADQKREYLGYNGFPRGVEDTKERLNNRELKYARVVHAELNAIIKAGRDAEGGTIYIWPLFSCNECAKAVIQSGIKRVVSPKPVEERWASSYDVALEMYNEAGVDVEFISSERVLNHERTNNEKENNQSPEAS